MTTKLNLDSYLDVSVDVTALIGESREDSCTLFDVTQSKALDIFLGLEPSTKVRVLHNNITSCGYCGVSNHERYQYADLNLNPSVLMNVIAFHVYVRRSDDYNSIDYAEKLVAMLLKEETNASVVIEIQSDPEAFNIPVPHPDAKDYIQWLNAHKFIHIGITKNDNLVFYRDQNVTTI